MRQDDQGFRAGRRAQPRRRAADGEVLVFLDGDTVPEPGYFAALAGCPPVGPDALVVGRRRHADLAAGPSGRLARRPRARAGPELPEPAWLARGLRRAAATCCDADAAPTATSSARCSRCAATCSPSIGGFDEALRSYGGEDWELAARAWHAGAVLAHVPDAVAWHDGPDWAGRADPRTKEDEERMLARLVPDPVDPPRRDVVVLPDDRGRRREPRPGRGGGRGGRDPAGGRGRRAVVARGPGRRRCPSRSAPACRRGRCSRARPPSCTCTGHGPMDPLLTASEHGVVTTAAGTAWRTRASGRAQRVARAGGGEPEQVVERLFGRRDLP